MGAVRRQYSRQSLGNMLSAVYIPVYGRMFLPQQVRQQVQEGAWARRSENTVLTALVRLASLHEPLRAALSNQVTRRGPFRLLRMADQEGLGSLHCESLSEHASCTSYVHHASLIAVQQLSLLAVWNFIAVSSCVEQGGRSCGVSLNTRRWQI